MGLKQLLRNMTFGLGLAFTSGCGSSFDSWPREGEAEVEDEEGSVSLGPEEGEGSVNLEAIVSSATTDENGIARFDDGEPITATDNENNPLLGVEVDLYQIYEDDFYQGDVYLAETPQNEGGIAVFANNIQAAANVRRYGSFGEKERKVTIQPRREGNAFDRARRRLVYSSMRWQAERGYSCEGVFTTEELNKRNETRRDVVKLISYVDPTGTSSGVVFVYDKLQFLIDIGVLEGMPSEKEWYSLQPIRSLGFEMLVQKDLAEEIYGREIYQQLVSECERPQGLEGEAESEGEECFSHDSRGCSGGDAYWYNSCGVREERYDDCSSSETCEAGRCIEDCLSHASRECSNGNVYWYDSCGVREERYDDCSSIETCEDGQCVAADPGRPDLDSDSLRASPSNPTIDNAITLSVTVRNTGSASPSCRYNLAREDNRTFRTGSIPAISPAGSTTIEILLGGEPEGTHTYVFTADATYIVNEDNESNNTSSLTLTVRP